MENVADKFNRDAARYVKKIFNLALMKIDNRLPDSTSDRRTELERLFSESVQVRAECVARCRTVGGSDALPERNLLGRLQHRIIAGHKIGGMLGTNTQDCEESEDDSFEYESVQSMVDQWRYELFAELNSGAIAMDEDYAQVLTVMDKLLNVNVAQFVAVNEEALDCVGTDPVSGSAFICEKIPDDAMVAFIVESDLSEEECDLLDEYDRGMFDDIQRRMCEEILLIE